MPKNTVPRRASAPKQPKTAADAPLPEWAAATPPDIQRDYALTMTGQPDQDLDITRAEFIKLKRHLAEMRGFKPEWEDQRGPSFLIGPQGHAPRALSADDFEHVSEYLNIRHSANDEACAAIRWLLHMASTDSGLSNRDVFEYMASHYLNCSDVESDRAGVLVRIFGGPQITEDLLAEEAETLQAALITLRAGGWFAEWLGLQLRRITSDPTDPARRYPTPLQIAASLREDILQHEDRVDTAREVMRTRPDILKLLAFPPLEAATEPAAAPESTQPATEQPAKAKRAPKPRKQARHA